MTNPPVDRPSDIRIALLAPPADAVGPMGEIAANLAEGLRLLGCRVEIAPWGSSVAESGAMAKRLRQRAQDAFAFRRRVTKERFDVVLLNTGHDWLTLGRDILLTLVSAERPPMAILVHGTSARLRLRRSAFVLASRILARLSEMILVLSAEEYLFWASAAPSARVEIVRNPYVRKAAGEFKRISVEMPLKLLFVGRLVKAKGLSAVLDAMSLLATEEVSLWVAGDGPERRSLESVAKTRGLDVSFFGQLRSADLWELYRRADVFVLPTKHDEGFPTVIAEALDFGLPIIATRARGMADILCQDLNAILIDADDVQALAGSIERLAAEPTMRAKMSTANQRLAEEFSPQVVAATYRALLISLVRDPARLRAVP